MRNQRSALFLSFAFFFFEFVSGFDIRISNLTIEEVMCSNQYDFLPLP